MNLFSKTVIAAAVVGLLATSIATQSYAQDAATAVKERVALMKANGGAAARIGKAEDVKAALADAKLIQANGKKLESLWPANSMTPDSRAKPEIWADMAGFKAALAKFQTSVDEVVAMADKGDLAAVKEGMKAVGGACGGCHRVYRGPEK